MLVINECGLSRAAHEEMKKRLSQLIKSGKRAYLIVPEQQTVSAEAEMARELPESAPLYFEVTNFTRLNDSTFRALGGISREHVDGARRALIMWRVLTELSPVLDLTRGRGDISEGLVKKALAALGELDSAAIGEEELTRLMDSQTLGKRLSKKINDIALIRSLYNELIGEKYGAAEDATLRCARLLFENTTHFSDAVFFVEGFTSFTEGQYKILASLMKRTELTVLLPIPAYGADGFEFSELRKTRTRLFDTAKDAKAERKLEKSGMLLGERPMLIEEAIRLIWRTDGVFDNDSLQNENAIRVFEAHTPFDECDFVAADIRRRVIEGASYSDFAIIARSEDEYLGVLDIALEKSDIPYFTSSTKEISESEAIKLIYTAYSAAEKFRREDVISYMKCGFSGIDREACDEFEIYIERWGLSGARLTDGVIYNMNPDGYTAKWRAEAADELLRINETRDRLIAPLLDFSKKTRGVHTVRRHAELLFEFLDSMGLEEKLAARGEEAERLWSIIADSLDTLVLALGDMTVSAEVFLSQLKILFSSVEIGRIPAVIDEVTVGGAELLRLNGKKHIYMLGVNDGKFPKNPKDESYFTDRDKAELAAHDIALSPETELKCARELFFFSRAMSFAERSVTLLYSLASTDFKPITRGEVITRLYDASGKKISPVKICDMPPEKRIFAPSPAKELSHGLTVGDRAAVDKALRAVGIEPHPTKETRIDNASLSLSRGGLGIIYSENLNLTQSRIDGYVKCPLSYFCNYNLSLDDTKPYELSYSGIGSYVHAVLENFFSHVEKNGLDLKKMTKDELERITLDASRGYITELSGGGQLDVQTKIMLNRLYRATLPVVEDICDELAASRFAPKFFELNISGAGKDTPEPIVLSYPEGSVTLYGQIDRVDTFREGDDVYVRVVDYKTGTKRFSPEDMKEGENLQMFLYLKAIVDSKKPSFKKRIGVGECGRLIPAGVIYAKTSLTDVKTNHDSVDEVKSEVKRSQGRQGMILDDKTAIEAQNPDYLPVKYKKDGSPTAHTEKYLYTPEGWDTLMNTVEDVIGTISAKMRGGNIHAAAKAKRGEKLPCEYCEYKPFCRKSSYD